MTQVIDGKLPPNTRCPYAKLCGGYREGWCLHKGYANQEEFYCALAKAYSCCETIKLNLKHQNLIKIKGLKNV